MKLMIGIILTVALTGCAPLDPDPLDRAKFMYVCQDLEGLYEANYVLSGGHNYYSVSCKNGTKIKLTREEINQISHSDVAKHLKELQK